MVDPEYVISITRQVANPKFKQRKSFSDNRGEDEREPYVERIVTSATLNAEQFQKVQRAIVEALA